MKTLYWVLGAIALVVLIIGGVVGWVAGTYNGLVSVDEQVKEAWANVETQYQRRIDLIPNLVDTVKGFAKQELTVFTEVTRMRSQWGEAKTAGNVGQQIAAARGLDGAIGRLLLVAENYPQLKSNENFLKLQDELAGTENRVAVARTRYNDVVKQYNVRTRSFPGNFIAGWFNFTQKTSFEAEAGAEKAPKVSFN